MLVHANPSLDVQRTSRGSSWWWLLIALEVLICLVIIWDTGAYSPDDAYIYFNGARQLARGELPNMTPGETPTNAWGSYLWLAMLTPGYLLGLNPLFWSKLLGVLLLLGTVWQLQAVVRLVRPGTPRLTAWALGGLLLTYAPAVYWSVSGLETLLNVFSLLLTVRLLLRDYKSGRLSAAFGLALGLQLVSRPDAFFNAALLAAAALWLLIDRRRPHRLREAWRPLVGLLPGLALFILPVFFYPTLLPTSALAKVPDIWANLPAILFNNTKFLLYYAFKTPGNLLIYLGAGWFLLSRDPDDETRFEWPLKLILALLALIHIGKYLLTGDWMGVQRLWLPSAVTALAVTLPLILRLVKKMRGRLALTPPLLCSLAAGLTGWRAFIFYHYNHPGSPAEEMGRLIARLKAEDSWMITTDMGVLPYFADVPAIDAEVKPICNYHLFNNPGDYEYIADHQLDFIVVTSCFYDQVGWYGRQKYGVPAEVLQRDYRRVMVAEWRPPYDFGFLIPFSGRYFHLFVHERLEPPEVSPVPLNLRGTSMAGPSVGPAARIQPAEYGG